MASNKRTIINKLLRNRSKGALFTSKWLRTQGVSSKLAWWYVQSGWFERVTDCVYQRAGETLTWASGIQALQSQLELPVHLGGKTALQLLGLTHYVPTSSLPQSLQLFAPPRSKLPRWFKTVSVETPFNFFSTQLLNDLDGTQQGLVEKIFEGLTLTISVPERAAIECCYLVPKVITFEECALIFENLTRLRPIVTQVLLEHCQSVKTKRLFLHLASYYQHDWLNDLLLNNVDLGKGKVVIGKGGEYYASYQISVPKLREQ